MTDSQPTDNPTRERRTITFHLIKGPEFQSRRVDGALVSLGPDSRACLSFYVERDVIPQTVTHELKEDGRLGKFVESTGKDGIVRELQFGVVLDEEGVRTLRDQMSKVLEILEKEDGDEC